MVATGFQSTPSQVLPTTTSLGSKTHLRKESKLFSLPSSEPSRAIAWWPKACSSSLAGRPASSCGQQQEKHNLNTVRG